MKFVPALIFAAVIRFRGGRTSLKFGMIAFVTVALVYLPLFSINAELASVSLRAQFEKPSYQTIWALVDGNYQTGNFGSVESHLSASEVYATGKKNPAVVPNWLRLVLAGGLGLLVYGRTRRFDHRGMLAFIGMTILIFYLQAQAWSPQWITLIIPLTVLVFPNRAGILSTVALTVLSFAEYPATVEPHGRSGSAGSDGWRLVCALGDPGAVAHRIARGNCGGILQCTQAGPD